MRVISSLRIYKQTFVKIILKPDLIFKKSQIYTYVKMYNDRTVITYSFRISRTAGLA